MPIINHHSHNTHTPLLTWGLVSFAALSVFAFFQLLFPYTLRHKEQAMFFIADSQWLSSTFGSAFPRPFVSVLGDFLTQFFYYPYIGPLAVSLLVTLIAVVFCNALRQLRVPLWLAIIFSALVMVCECCRICGMEYPIASTIQLLLWSVALWCASSVASHFLFPKHNTFFVVFNSRHLTLVFVALLCLYIGGMSLLPEAKWWNTPKRHIERLLAIDSNAYYGNWTKVEDLSAPMLDYPIALYYNNLAKASQGRLPDDMMQQPMVGASRLFLPVDSHGNYVNFTAANEAWYAIGDMTTAEHATILGMIFSPRHLASRNMRRLAQIAMRRGDEKGAMKYLRLLSRNAVHGSWAKRQMQHDLQPSALGDTLSLTDEYAAPLRNLLNHDAGNAIARDYLLCYDLLTHNLQDFTADVNRYGCDPGHRLYEEAMLVVMQFEPLLRDTWHHLVSESAYRDFISFNAAFEASHGSAKALAPQFRNTYWYFLHFHDLKDK